MRSGRCALVVVLGVVLALGTVRRVAVWQDERGLWQEAVQMSPRKPRPWVNLGRQYALHGSPALAADCFRQAMALSAARPDDERRDATRLAHQNLDRLSVDLIAWLTAPL